MNMQTMPNRLAGEKSPYLLQHAGNPVDWWPWCEEAFLRARQEDKPVFLSIGYSTCHWCHVMERESFEDPEVAAILNRDFISVKVDREERPDIDSLYMNACVALNGGGGWPLTVLLDHERRPFWTGTYLPKENTWGRIGLIGLLEHTRRSWREERDKLHRTAEGLMRHLSRAVYEGGRPASDAPRRAVRELLANEDAVFGGFGGAPKFPAPHNLLFLMRMGEHDGPGSPLWRTVCRQLDGMAAGGIRDHVGGGFCRYSTDEKWMVPHFEKMLVDNALLLMAYAECGQKTGQVRYVAVAEETARFLLRELSAPEGGFYTAIDADSEGVEGKFYLFTPEEIWDVFSGEDADRFCRLYGITEEGNFEGGSIPNLIGRPLCRDDSAFAASCMERLYAYRARRQQPLRDEKQTLSGTALAAAAFALAGRALGRPEWIARAEQAADFIIRELIYDIRLLAVFKDGQAYLPATADGYAYFTWALLELHRATLDTSWLSAALFMQMELDNLFSDGNGSLYLSGSDADDLPLRPSDSHDGALPSANSVAMHNAFRLYRLTGDPEWREFAENQLTCIGGALNQHPTAYIWSCAALDGMQKTDFADVVIAEGRGMDGLLDVFDRYCPGVSLSACGRSYPGIEELAPFTAGMTSVAGQAAAYVCRGGSCSRPVTDPEELRGLIFG